LKEIADFLGVHYTTVSKVVASTSKKEIFQDLTPKLFWIFALGKIKLIT
jgi:hypothetical protein